MTIVELVKELDEKLTTTNEEYHALFKELTPLSGRVLGDEDYKKGIEILNKIQDKYAEMHPAFNFIGTRYQFAKNSVDSYYDWIKKLEANVSMQGPDPIS